MSSTQFSNLNAITFSMLEHFYEKKIKSSLMMANFKLKKFIEKININIGKEHLDEIFVSTFKLVQFNHYFKLGAI